MWQLLALLNLLLGQDDIVLNDRRLFVFQCIARVSCCCVLSPKIRNWNCVLIILYHSLRLIIQQKNQSAFELISLPTIWRSWQSSGHDETVMPSCWILVRCLKHKNLLWWEKTFNSQCWRKIRSQVRTSNPNSEQFGWSFVLIFFRPISSRNDFNFN